MSMILDALSRAERERRQEQPHELDTGRYVTSSSIKEDRYKKWVFIALLVNFILIIVILLGYLWNTGAFSGIVSNNSSEPSSTQQSVPPVVASKPPVSVSTEPQQTVQSAPQASTTGGGSLMSEARVAKPPSAPAPKPLPKVATAVPPVTYSNKPIKQNKKPSIPVEEILAVRPSSAKSEYMQLTDLAPAQRSKLNNYEVNVHVYDENPQKSFVLINMTKYKEGDKLPGGERVDSIVPEGVVINFSGGRVLIERN